MKWRNGRICLENQKRKSEENIQKIGDECNRWNANVKLLEQKFEQAQRDLSEKRENGDTYDVIVLDPPAFTKTVDTVKEGYRGYKDVNKKALKLVKKGGFLVTCSCSQHMTINLFTQMLREATKECGINARLVELRIQAKDHANSISYDECLYLKVAILRID
ncbi:MAG: class I SAM-dependent methyltransferase [Clostridia bacterium]|nr:class I SAM-dependent methyltransferase [Clostridia bacterium]